MNHLTLSWSVSRGADTYGYNICRLDSRDSGRRYRCMGGGYDMTGTVFGDWLEAEHQDKLRQLTGWESKDYGNTDWKAHADLYGAFLRPDGSVSLDGGCGLACMIRVAEAIGLEIERDYIASGRRRGETIGWFVTERV